jgi:hypothetical protein
MIQLIASVLLNDDGPEGPRRTIGNATQWKLTEPLSDWYPVGHRMASITNREQRIWQLTDPLIKTVCQVANRIPNHPNKFVDQEMRPVVCELPKEWWQLLHIPSAHQHPYEVLHHEAHRWCWGKG